MREIKFRGRDIDQNEWRYGSYVAMAELDGTILHYIVELDGQQWIVFPETVGQYTGLKDKNGIEIFEGDVIRTTSPDCTAVVVWEQGTVRNIGYTIESERKIVYVDRVDRNDKSAVEVIGNIYENKELLEAR